MVTTTSYEQQLKASGISYSYRTNLSESEILAAYHQADIVSLVSTYEGFGLPIIEAQAIGRAVIAGNVASMPEVAGEGACLVDPHDVTAIRSGILRIINEPGYRNAIVEQGFQNVKRFDPQLIADSTWNFTWMSPEPDADVWDRWDRWANRRCPNVLASHAEEVAASWAR